MNRVTFQAALLLIKFIETPGYLRRIGKQLPVRIIWATK